ncbi:phytase [Candidatus Bipolaricaulota bacterium]|nr:phytase [Candidatus Bipolaricaulota bacterium]
MRNIRNKKWTALCFLIAVALVAGSLATFGDVDILQPRLSLVYDGIDDTDDMCIWIHPTDASLSTIIVADKAADMVVVFDLSGNTLQTIQLLQTPTGSEQPGNIDLRYGFSLGGEVMDIVALNQRSPSQGRGFRIYKIDPDTRLLTRIDDGAAMDHANYGMCLYKSPSTGKFYAFATSSSQGVEQYELVDNGEGQISLVFVRAWDQTKCEGAVADDELGYVYIAEEKSGLWRYDAEPDGSIEGTHIAVVGENGYDNDAEGVTIYYARDGGGYIIASSQGNDTFIVYDRLPPHAYVKTFSLEGVEETDGVDVTNVNLGSAFPYGLFVCHANGKPSIAVVTAYEDLGLDIDTSYDPRTGTYESE